VQALLTPFQKNRMISSEMMGQNGQLLPNFGSLYRGLSSPNILTMLAFMQPIVSYIMLLKATLQAGSMLFSKHVGFWCIGG
jgi:hypothetical protein